MEEKYTIEATAPVCSYGNIHFKIEGGGSNFKEFNKSNMPEIKRVFNKYSESPMVEKDGTYVECETFTGETVLYDDENHLYKDLDGNKLISASVYKKNFEEPFPLDIMADNLAKKYGVESKTIKEMWKGNSNISTTFGSAIHYAMEHFWLHKEHGCDDKEYHLSKHPIIRGAVDKFPVKDHSIMPEVMVSSVKRKMVGQIDGIEVIKDKTVNLWDYKTDAELDAEVFKEELKKENAKTDKDKDKVKKLKDSIKKAETKLRLHFIQLSFYASILEEFGWKVEKIIVWNYTGEWKSFEEKPFDLKELRKELQNKKK